MTTTKQITSNRQNAQLSTGPKTAEGKAVAKMNAVSHGLLATNPVLADESPEQYEAFRQAMMEELQPTRLQEAILADRIVSIAWRLRRLTQIENGPFEYGYHDRIAQRAKREAEAQVVVEEFRIEDDWMERIRTVKDEEAYEYARREQRWAEDRRDRGTAKTAAALLSDCGDGFARLHRYEVGLEKSFYRAMHQLERLQAVRSGGRRQAGATTQILAVSVQQDGNSGLMGSFRKTEEDAMPVD